MGKDSNGCFAVGPAFFMSKTQISSGQQIAAWRFSSGTNRYSSNGALRECLKLVWAMPSGSSNTSSGSNKRLNLVSTNGLILLALSLPLVVVLCWVCCVLLLFVLLLPEGQITRSLYARTSEARYHSGSKLGTSTLWKTRQGNQRGRSCTWAEDGTIPLVWAPAMMKPDKQNKSMPADATWKGRLAWCGKPEKQHCFNQLHVVDRSFPYPLRPWKTRAGAVGSHWQDLPPSTGINWRRKAGTRRIRGLAPASGLVHPNDPLRSRLAATLRMRLVAMINMTISPPLHTKAPLYPSKLQPTANQACCYQCPRR